MMRIPWEGYSIKKSLELELLHEKPFVYCLLQGIPGSSVNDFDRISLK